MPKMTHSIDIFTSFITQHSSEKIDFENFENLYFNKVEITIVIKKNLWKNIE